MRNLSKLKIGLTGNPNTGKSTLFNALTGAKQHVGNWPGKTVDKKEGNFTYNNNQIQIVDLPGSYSLTAYTEEETITTDFILEEKPDVIVQILDAQNLERNLYMTLQLIELRTPLVIAINMVDLAIKKNIKIDTKKLSILLNIPIVIIDARRKRNFDKLLDAILKQAKNKNHSFVKLKYGTEVNDELEALTNIIERNEKGAVETNLNWAVLKLLEGDLRVEQKFTKKKYYLDLKMQLERSKNHLENIFNKDISNILAITRYGFIKGLSKEIIQYGKNPPSGNTSDKIDNILTNRFIGIPIFLIIAWLMFQATFVLSEPLMGWIESFMKNAGNRLISLLTSWNTPDLLKSLIVDGVIGGVGGVLVFIPIIGIMFMIIAIMEDTGYMARVAFIMDKLMHIIGLHGKAFIPMILGFGCNVPGIMATRTIENKKDRLVTILINPFISCGARLPVYALFAGAFFSANRGWVIFSLYFGGVAIAIMMGLILKIILSKNLSSPFVIELPPYRWPSLKGLMIHVWERVWLFIKKAGTIILAFSIIIWALASFPLNTEYGSQESLAEQAGTFISPVFEPLGFGNWQSSVALIFGFAAKEVVVGTFGTLYGVEDTNISDGVSTLSEALKNDFTPLSAYAFMVFILLYTPCMAVLAVVKRETNTWKWPLIMVIYTTAIAWTFSFLIYQGGTILGFG